MDTVALFDSVPIELRVDSVAGALDLVVSVLTEDAPGAAWFADGDGWAGHGREAAEVIDNRYRPAHEHLAMLDDESGLAPALDAVDCTLMLDDRRLRWVLDRIADEDLADHENGGDDDPIYDPDTWPTRRFWVCVQLTFFPPHGSPMARLVLSFSLWTNPPRGFGPNVLRSRETDPLSVDEMVQVIGEFRQSSQSVSMLGMFFQFERLGVRPVFGSRWLPPVSVLVQPVVANTVPRPSDYFSGEWVAIATAAASAVFDKNDLHDSSLAASALENASLCLHRQVASAAYGTTDQVFSSYLHLPITADPVVFEDRVQALIRIFETIETEISSELWDVSTDLEMAEAQFGVLRLLANQGGELVDALVVRLLDTDDPVAVPRRHLRRRAALGQVRARFRDSIELVRRTLLQTELERESALEMVIRSEGATHAVRSFVEGRVGQLLTRASVDGYPTVTTSLLESEKFGQVERNVRLRREDATSGARLGNMLETTTHVFGEERERVLAAVERNSSLLNFALGIVALFTVVDFLVVVQFTPTSDVAVFGARGLAGAAGAAVLTTLGWLWVRGRRVSRPNVRSAFPELHNEVIARTRMLRATSAMAGGQHDLDVDLEMSHRIAELFDVATHHDQVVTALREAYLLRVRGGEPDADLVQLAEQFSPVLHHHLAGRYIGPDWDAAADLELLWMESSIWSVRAVLFGERPSRMYNARLPLTTTTYYLHREHRLVSRFEVEVQMSEDHFAVVAEIDRSAPQSASMVEVWGACVGSLIGAPADATSPPELDG